MNYCCIYCKNELMLSEGFLVCQTCPNTKYIYGRNNGELKLIWVFFEYFPYCIDISLIDNKTYMFKHMEQDALISLDYVPNINPNNSEKWVDRLLNMMIFT